MESSSSTEYKTVWSAPPKKPSGRTKFKETRHPVYRGVRRRGTTNRWVCEVRNSNNKSRIWLGTFPTAEMAARAHDVAVMALRGRSACLNFADSASLISIPSSLSSVKELKQAAIEAAKTLHSSNSSDSAENISSLASSTETVDEKEVISSSSTETVDKKQVISSSSTETVSKSNPVANDQMDSNWDGDGDMNLALYYASLAEGLMLDPPFDWIGDLDDNQWCTTVSLWS